MDNEKDLTKPVIQAPVSRKRIKKNVCIGVTYIIF